MTREWSFGEQVPEEAPVPTAPRLAEGVTWAGFRLLEPLGHGASGCVRRAVHLATGREVALKVVRGAASPERLRREGQLVAALDHPGIVRLLDRGEEGGVPWLAYEVVGGGRTLEDALPGLSRERGLPLVLEVARAVAHAHARGVIHRDLKPSNVLLDGRGRARLTDFGLGKGGDLARLTQSGTMVGTAAWMAPEQLRGEVSATGPWSDVWSLGALLYRVLTGQSMHRATTLAELATELHAGPPRPPRSLDPAISPALEQVCLRALALAPEQRHPDAGALLRDLELAAEACSSRVAPLRVVGVSIAALIATAAALGLLLARQGEDPPPVPPPVEGPEPNLRPAEATLAAAGDPARPLEEALRRHPGEARPRVELARYWLDRGAIGVAFDVLQDAPARQDDALLEALRAAIDALAVVDLARLERLEGPARLEAARGLLAQGALGLDLLLRAGDPRHPRHPAGNPPPARLARARAVLEQVVALAPGTQLEGQAHLRLAWLEQPGSPASDDALRRAAVLLDANDPFLQASQATDALARGDTARCRELAAKLPLDWRRGRLSVRQLLGAASLREGQAERAIELLLPEVGWGADDADTLWVVAEALRVAGRGAKADQVGRHIRALEGAEVDAVRDELAQLGADELHDAARLARLLRRAPLVHDLRLRTALAELKRLPGLQAEPVLAALREGFEACRWSGDLLLPLALGLEARWDSGEPGGVAALLVRTLPFDERKARDRLVRAGLRGLAILRGRKGALPPSWTEELARDLSLPLQSEPAEPLAHTLLGLVELERGRPLAALHELETALTIDPRIGAAAFLEVVVLARRGVTPREMAALLAGLREMPVGPWAEWKGDSAAWPELEPYLGAPGCEELGGR